MTYDGMIEEIEASDKVNELQKELKNLLQSIL